MWFWWFILICDCFIPAIMIIAGRMMWKHCPKKINGIMGYRTKMSMINMDTWRFAHDHAGKLWWKVGIGLLGPTMLIHIPFYGASDDTIGILSIIIIVIQLVFLIGSIFPTEKALKNNFNPVGNSDICLNGKRLTAADLFSLTGNSILKHDLSFYFCNL